MNTPNNLEWLDEIVNRVVGVEVYSEVDTIGTDYLEYWKIDAKQTIATKLSEAYKQGYIDGGIATLTNDKEQE